MILDQFVPWKDRYTSLVFRKDEFKPTPRGPERKTSHFGVKAAKRGNDVYRVHILKRMGELEKELPDVEYYDPDRVREIQQTQTLFITLTYDPKRVPLHEAWRRVGKDFNRFKSALMARYGRVRCERVGTRGHLVKSCPDCYDLSVSHIRTWEAHASGYPHIHTMLSRPAGSWPVRYRGRQHKKDEKSRAMWRLASWKEKQGIANLWGHGHVDVQGVYNPVEAIGYITKELTKSLWASDDKSLKTLALTWAFNRRIYGISGDLAEAIQPNDLINKCIIQTTLSGNAPGSPVEIVYLGAVSLKMSSGEGDLGPPWHLDFDDLDLTPEVLHTLHSRGAGS